MLYVFDNSAQTLHILCLVMVICLEHYACIKTYKCERADVVRFILFGDNDNAAAAFPMLRHLVFVSVCVCVCMHVGHQSCHKCAVRIVVCVCTLSACY